MSSMPIITLEVISEPSNAEPISNMTDNEEPANSVETPTTSQSTEQHSTTSNIEPDNDHTTPKVRTDLLEYMMRDDGSVICKLCGEILQSRTHWYRHKYKLHVVHPLNPTPLFQCEQCLVYFKSRKGYIGHIASRHNEDLLDSSPVLTNAQVEASATEGHPTGRHPSLPTAGPQTKPLTTTQSVLTQTQELSSSPLLEVKEEPDPELSIPMSSVPNYQATVVKQNPTKSTETKKPSKGNKDWEAKRSREEKLVADIIDRVRRECEAQGSGGAARRGYTRRTTVMHT